MLTLLVLGSCPYRDSPLHSPPLGRAYGVTGLRSAVKRISVLVVFLAFGLLAGCSSSSSSNNQVTLTAIQVSPGTASVALGHSQSFTAKGTFSNSTTQDLTSSVSWTSSATSIATISSGGMASTKGQGSATITAAMSGVSGTAVLQVTAPILVSVAVTPASPTLSPGMFQQFTATGTYSDGSTKDLTSTATWTSSADNFATITSAGYLTARALGTSTITASSGSVNGTTTLTVAPPTLNSIVISGGNVTIAAGTSHPFVALGIYSDGGERTFPNGVTWASSQTGVAMISMVGVAAGVAAGTTTISATSGSVTKSVTLTVSSATVNPTLAIAPSTDTIEPYTRLPFTAVGSFSDGTTQVITSFAMWGSSNTSAASFGTTGQIGVATAQGAGLTTISATVTGATGSVPLTVSPSTLTGLTLPSTASIAVGSTDTLRVTAQYNDGGSVPVGTAVNWQSSDTSVATVDATTGTINAVGTGTTTITATLQSATASTTLTVENLSSIAIAPATPATPNVAAGTFVRFAATGTLSDGTTQDLTPSVTWTSSSPAVALMSNVAGTFGGAIGLTQGTSTIGAVLDGVVGSSQVTVTGATLSSITLTPANPSIALGTSQQFKAVGNFSDGSTETLTNQVSWTSSDVGVAIVDANGAADSSGTGSSTITATMGTVSSNTTLTVH